MHKIQALIGRVLLWFIAAAVEEAVPGFFASLPSIPSPAAGWKQNDSWEGTIEEHQRERDAFKKTEEKSRKRPSP